MKVLVVEDREPSQNVARNALRFDDPRLVKALRERGIQITAPDPDKDIIIVDSYETASKQIRNAKAPFDLVLLDLLIPKKSGEDVDPEDGPLRGYELVSEIRSRFGDQTAIVVYSQFLSSSQNRELARRGLFEFTGMLRGRDLAPPNEMLWKELYEDSASLMVKLVRYAVDLSADDEKRLEKEGILVPKAGAIRRVLRELKRMACSASIGFPRPDVLLLGENGVGKTTFARAYHLLRPRPPQDQPQLGFQHLDLGSLDFAGSAPNIALFGATDFNGAWSLGAFARSTLYKRGHEFVAFAGQEVQAGSPTLYAPLGRSSYPETPDQVDFDGSGTLFLDEVVNIGLETQAMLLQALSYDLHSRHVYTTGHEPRRLRVGPSLVFATAQWNPSEAVKPPEEMPENRRFRGMKDYLFRIDQMRVTIPPLRDREPEEVIQLLTALVRKRRPHSTAEVSIDPIVEKILTGALLFRRNVADLQQIADQVMPEENTITWQHVGPLFERERPLVPELRISSPASQSHSPTRDYKRAREIYKQYCESGRRVPLSRLARKPDISQTEAYNTALIFMDECSCATLKRWPTEKDTMEAFGHGAKAFQTYIHRLSNHRNVGFGLADALRDLAKLKGFPVDEDDVSKAGIR